MSSLAVHLQQLTGLTEQQVARELERRAGQPSQALDLSADSLPSWAEQTAARWLVALWSQERSECDAGYLWSVDQKYTKILKRFTVAEIIAMLNEMA